MIRTDRGHIAESETEYRGFLLKKDSGRIALYNDDVCIGEILDIPDTGRMNAYKMDLLITNYRKRQANMKRE